MKRSWAAMVCATLLAVGGAVLYAESPTSLSLAPSEMKNGETKTITDDGKTITVRREDNTTHVTIDHADRTERLTITREGGRLRVTHSGSNQGYILIDPARPESPRLRTLRQAGAVFVCPKDRTMLRVPEANEDGTFKCPVDGTVMEKRKGRGFTFFFDEDSFESHVL